MSTDFPSRSYDEWKTRVDNLPNGRQQRGDEAVDGPDLPLCDGCNYYIDECVCDDPHEFDI